MGIKFSALGRQNFFDNWVTLSSGHISVGVFINDYTPAANSDLDADLAGHEPGYTGYARQALSGGGTQTDSGTVRTIVFGPNLFGPTADAGAPVLIYGYFLYHGDYGIIAAERFGDAPRTVQFVGDYCPVVPKSTLGDV